MTRTPSPLGQTLDATRLIEHLRRLRHDRRHRPIIAPRKARRYALTQSERAAIAAKTDGRCHICGGVLDLVWEADHVVPHSTGGLHRLENYLPAHALCNNYRWSYSPEEFQWVLKIGVWARLVMEQSKPIGRQMTEQFCGYERGRVRRRK